MAGEDYYRVLPENDACLFTSTDQAMRKNVLALHEAVIRFLFDSADFFEALMRRPEMAPDERQLWDARAALREALNESEAKHEWLVAMLAHNQRLRDQRAMKRTG